MRQTYYSIRSGIVAGELSLLKKLGFHVHIQHPHGLLMSYLNQLELAKDAKFRQTAWAFLNDRSPIRSFSWHDTSAETSYSYRTNVAVKHEPFVVAVAMIYLAAEYLNRPMETSPPWYTFFDTTREDILRVKEAMQWMYSATPPKYIPHTRGELEDYLANPTAFIKETDALAKSLMPRPTSERVPPPPSKRIRSE